MLEQIPQFFQFLTIPFHYVNFIDVVIIFIIIVFVIEGYALGFIRGILDFLSFIISFAFALTFYDIFGQILVMVFLVPQGLSNAIGFFLAAILCEIIITLVIRYFVLPFILDRTGDIDYPKGMEKAMGIIPGILSAVVLLAFLLTLLVAFPFSPFLASSISSSRLGSPLVSNIQGLDKELNNVFGGAVNDALTFLTVEPKSEDLLKLNFSTGNIKANPDAELEMFKLLNTERVKVGLKPLDINATLLETGRKHCLDMFQRGYFSHYTPEGKSPFDRMAEDNVKFTFAGENLALAPNAKLAMQGLMNSPGHKANILSKKFGEVGIGIIDGGVYGQMFCQEFKD